MTRRLLAAVATGAVALSVITAVPAVAGGTDIDTRVARWDEAAASLGTAGSLWEPRRTAGLPRASRIQVVADGLAFANGAATAGDTVAAALYRRHSRTLRVQEKWADTGWAAEPTTGTSSARVGTVRIRLGDPGTQISLTATVYANCFPQPASGDPRPVPRGFRCSRADVRTHGGTLVMTARPPSTMTAPGDTSVVLQSTGLTYDELVDAARSLQQVAGAPTVAGSAQMVAMCRQMVDGRLTVEQATAFAQSNGYTARVGSIDGQSLPVTADYRPDRFTLDVVSGAVTGCHYG